MESDASPASQPPSVRRNLRELFRREISGKSWNRSGRTLNTLSSHSSHDDKSSRKDCQHSVSFVDEATDSEVRLVESCETYAEPLSEEERSLYSYTVRNSRP